MPTVMEPQRPPLRTTEPPRDRRNVGGGDQTARVLIGIVLLLAGYYSASGWGQDVLYALGALSLFTAFTRYCPINALLGRNTCRRTPPYRDDRYHGF